MISNIVPAASLVAAGITRETFSVGGVDVDVISTPAMRAEVEVDSEIQTVTVAANGMTVDKLSNDIVDEYTWKMGTTTEGVIGFADNTAVLLDRLSPASPRTPLDSSSFTAAFAQQTGGKVLAFVKRVSVVPPRDRLLEFGMTQARMDLFMRGNHPAPAMSWYDGVGIFAWLTAMTKRQWGFPDNLEHEVTGRAGRDPREFPYPTWSGTRGALPYEARYEQPWATGVTVANRFFSPTPWGHHDMAGNLWEWMQRRLEPGSSYRSVRAGSWYNDFPYLRARLCRDYNPTSRLPFFGLRGRVEPKRPG